MYTIGQKTTNMYYDVSLNSGVFPIEWKTAKVKPLYRNEVGMIFKITDQYQYYLCFQKYWKA